MSERGFEPKPRELKIGALSSTSRQFKILLNIIPI